MEVFAISILFFITARSGSKGIPGKNLHRIGDESLIGWKARAAQVVIREYCDDARIVISTDSDEMAAEAKKHGVDVPFMRPAELATDEAKSADVIAHAMEWIEANWHRAFDDIMLLEPSSPFASPEDFYAALRMRQERNSDLICGMRRTSPSRVFIGPQPRDSSINLILFAMQRHGPNLRRQDIEPEWTPNGSLYLFSWDMFKRLRNIYGGGRNFGLLMDDWHSIDIDTPRDLELAEYAFARGYVTLPPEPSSWKLALKQALSATGAVSHE